MFNPHAPPRPSLPPPLQRAAGQLSEIMNGTWYSTQRKGQCTHPSQVIGKDCWWREVEQTRMINATCVNDNMIKVQLPPVIVG